ncbi:MAG: MATE family efflux transporter [Clostridia bacterium]|nr:MATE family efflux transporter [Clostridia bacterium]
MQKTRSRGTFLSKLIGDRAFYSVVLSIVIPVIIQNTVTNVVSLLDNVMVGRVGTLEMSSVAIVNQLLFIFNLCIFGGLAGAGIFATQYAGAKDNEGVRHCFRVKWMIALAMVAVALAVFLLIPKPLISIYLAEGTSAQEVEATLSFSMEYLMIMLWGLLPFAVSQIYSSTLREVGETKLPMLAGVVAILVNLVFNYLLIFGKFGFPELGVGGAAIATVLSRYVELAIIVVYTHVRKDHFLFINGAYRSLYVPGPLMGDIMKKGMPLLVNEFFWSAGMAMLLQCYSVRGLDVVAACNIATTVSNLFKVVFLSMGNAVAIMVGQALGANEVERAKDTAWKLMALSVMCNVVMGVMILLLAPAIPQIYNTEQHVRDIATDLLDVIAVMMPLYAIAHCCYFTLRSGGRTIITFIFDSGYTWCICVPGAYILAHLTQLPIVPLYFGVQALELIKVIFGLILVKNGLWVRNIVGGDKDAEAAC